MDLELTPLVFAASAINVPDRRSGGTRWAVSIKRKPGFSRLTTIYLDELPTETTLIETSTATRHVPVFLSYDPTTVVVMDLVGDLDRR